MCSHAYSGNAITWPEVLLLLLSIIWFFFSVSHASLCFCLNYRQMLPSSGLCVNRGCGWVLPMINAVGVLPQFLIMGARKELCSTRRVYFLALVVMSFKAGSGSSHMISLSLTLSLVFTK